MGIIYHNICVLRKNAIYQNEPCDTKILRLQIKIYNIYLQIIEQYYDNNFANKNYI